MNDLWLAAHPAAIPAQISTKAYSSLVELMAHAYTRHAALPAYRFLGKDFSFEAIDQTSLALAAWLIRQGLKRGDRVAVMMPNIPQYPVAAAAVLRAGCVLVNVNPALAGGELEFQLKDSGAKAILLLENHAAALQAALPRAPVPTIVIAALGDMLGPIKGSLVNYVERNSRRAVPPYELPKAVRFNDALAQGQSLPLALPPPGPDDLAVLQYTSGTTALSKGAVLLHRHAVANVLQTRAWFQPMLQDPARSEQTRSVCVLPLHNSFGFHLGVLLGPLLGVCNLLMAHADDTPAVIKELADEHVHWFLACNGFFRELAQHPGSAHLRWSGLKLSLCAGAPLQPKVAAGWESMTGCVIDEAYGLSEAGPFVTCTVLGSPNSGRRQGLPLPGSELVVLDDDGHAVGTGVTGEIAVHGPQVMAGYWQRPDETARQTTATGFLRTGDLGELDESGSLRVVGRKRDRIQVSGNTFYPHEVEDALASMPGVREVAALGIPDGSAGESVKVVVVKDDPALGADDVLAFSRTQLPEPLRPRSVEFRASLPRSAQGLLMRRELRA